MSDFLRGTISTEHTVWCARARNVMDALPFKAKSTVGDPHGCRSHHSCSGTAREAAKEAKAQKWKLTSEFGWLCPPCARAYREWRTR